MVQSIRGEDSGNIVLIARLWGHFILSGKNQPLSSWDGTITMWDGILQWAGKTAGIYMILRSCQEAKSPDSRMLSNTFLHNHISLYLLSRVHYWLVLREKLRFMSLRVTSWIEKKHFSHVARKGIHFVHLKWCLNNLNHFPLDSLLKHCGAMSTGLQCRHHLCLPFLIITPWKN